MFGLNFNHTKTSVIGKDGSPFEVANVLIAGIGFVVQGAGTVALVVALTPILFMSWSDKRMIFAMALIFAIVFMVSFSIMGYIGWYMYKKSFVQPRAKNGQYAGKLNPVFVNEDGSKKLYYEYRGVRIPREDLEKLVNSQ